MKEKLPAGLMILCNDLGEIEQIIHDSLGLVAAEDGKTGKMVFLRLVERASLEKARAFLTDLRINRKVTDRELSLQTKTGLVNALFAGVKSGNQFVIVAAETAADRDKLFAEVLATVEEQKETPRPSARAIKEKEPLSPPPPDPEKVEKKRPAPLPETISENLENTRDVLSRAQEDLDKAQQDFYELATIDTITGLYNRRHFIKRLREELRETERYKRSPAFLMMDIDGFKAINDHYGLTAGDEIIRSVGEVARSVLRKVDLVGRLGPDEFGVLVIETSLENSSIVAKRLQKKLTGVAIEVEGRAFHVTVCIALIYVGTSKTTADKLIKQAEKMLQKAKENGGNQIIQE